MSSCQYASALEAKVKAESNKVELSAGVFTKNNQRLQVIRNHIRPDLSKLMDELKAVSPAQITKVDRWNSALDKILKALYRKKFANSTILGTPAHHSTPRSSLGFSLNLHQHRTKRRGATDLSFVESEKSCGFM